MIGFTYEQIPADQVRNGVERRLACTENLMMAIMDFYDGPKEQPDPPHSHPHEQVSYVAAGEILFIMDEQQIHLKAGDVFMAPSGKPHTIQQLTQHVRLIDCFTPLREDFLKR